jgi:hypothetical protein
VRASGANRRLSVVVVDQVLSGASNILIALLSAHMLGTAAFGYFGLILIIYAAAQGVNRSLVGDPLMVHPDDARQRVGAPISAALIVGGGIGSVVALIGAVLWVTHVPLGPELVILGVALPGLILHDLGRYLGFVTQRPWRSMQLDTLWLVLLLGVVAWLLVQHNESLSMFTLGWVGSGAVASMLVFVQHRPHLSGGWPWLKERWYYSWRFLLSFTALQGSSLGFSVLIAIVASARALGAIRGVLLLLRPYVTFQTASVSAGVAEVANDPDSRGTSHVRRTVSIAILLLLPDSIGRLILADTWEATKPLLPPACLQILALGFIAGPRAYLIGQKAVSRTVPIDIASTALTVVMGTVGVIWDGAYGSVWGVGLSNVIAAAVWWSALRAHAHPRGRHRA